MDIDFDDATNDNATNDKVEITFKGSARAISDVLNGKLASALEDKAAALAKVDRLQDEYEIAQSKQWDRVQEAEEKLRLTKSDLDYAQNEQERLKRLVRERNDEIANQEKTIAELQAQAQAQAQNLTEEQIIKLAEERERVFQSLVGRIVFPSLKPLSTFNELFTHFFFPLFADREYGKALSEGRKITLIKMVRECTGCGLKEAKDFVEGTNSKLT